jgi:hypothetical protein
MYQKTHIEFECPGIPRCAVQMPESIVIMKSDIKDARQICKTYFNSKGSNGCNNVK